LCVRNCVPFEGAAKQTHRLHRWMSPG
jgi:hypothetical protein